MLFFALMPFFIAFQAVFYFYVWGARAELEKSSSSYATALYRSLGQQLLHRAYPIRANVLFFHKAPLEIQSTIRIMRIMVIINVAFTAVLVVLIVGKLIR